MASKRAISYQWRLFLPVLFSFWTIIVCMAWWQVYRVTSIKETLVYDQLNLVSERIATQYDEGVENQRVVPFIGFINDFYNKSRNYDNISVIVRDAVTDETLVSSGFFTDEPFELPPLNQNHGKWKCDPSLLADHSVGDTFLYYSTSTADKSKNVYVLLPYTLEVAEQVSAGTTRFWMIFFGIALFVTIFAYISSSYVSRSIKILRDFANEAAANPNFKPENLPTDLPHDEFGDVSRQIILIYNQRLEEMEKREQEHRVALNAIEEKARMKRELTGNISHELKTPVGVVQGYIDTIIDNPDMDQETRDRFMFKVQENTHRLSALISDITAITRLESGGKLVDVHEINFHDLVFTLAEYVEENNLTKGKLKFSYDVPLNCNILGNDNLVAGVLMNFIKNAVAYSGGTKCVLECTGEDDDFYYFTFYDDGVGVAPEHLPHMFDRFYRVNAGRSRKAGGTGLGLTIVEVTITSHGGTVEVGNRYPHGLEFKFSFKKFKRRNSESADQPAQGTADEPAQA